MGFKPMEQLRNGYDIKRLHALAGEISAAEVWFGLLFLSPSHPMVPSILTGINVPIMCADSLDNLDAYQDWIEACSSAAEDMFR